MKSTKLPVKDYFISFTLFCIGIFTRLPFIEKVQSHWDGSLFSIAVVRYSIEKNTPPPPGHPLYIAMGRFFYYFVGDPHVAILLVSVLFSGLSAAAFYLAGKIIYNRTTGIIASSIFLSGSVFYYFGLTPYSFLVLPAYWCMIAVFSYQQLFKKKRVGGILAVLFAFGVGVRPQELLFLTPLLIYIFSDMVYSEKIKFLLTFILTCLIWFIPLVYIEGGPANFIQLITSSAVHHATVTYSIGIHLLDIELMVKDFLLSLGLAGFGLVYYFLSLSKRILLPNKRLILFYTFWILPSFLFNLFILSVHAGYQMDYLIALVLISSYGVYKMLNKNGVLLWGFVLLVLFFNLTLFFWNRDPNYIKPYRPTSFHFTDIGKNDLKLGSKITFIKNHFDSSSTLIITTSTLWSPYMYHLKEYKQYSIEALFTFDKNFSNTRRDSYNWNTDEYIKKDWNFTTPHNIKRLILVDDEYETKLIGLTGKIYYLPGNSRIFEVPVVPGERISYGYRYIKKDN